MSLANFLLRSALGNDRAPDHVDVALFNGPVEVKDSGYKRATIAKGSWNISNERANALATFGPIRRGAEFDRAVVFKGQQIVDEQVLPGGKRTNKETDVIRLEIELDLTDRKK